MTIDRRIFFISGILYAALLNAGGQDVQISVAGRDSKPLPFAFVMINGRTVEVTDTSGVSVIPEQLLSDNDTISVSYIGMNPAWIVYDRNLKRKKKHGFHLTSDYTTGESSKSHKEFEKQFRESIIGLPEINYNCKMNAKFYARVVSPAVSEPVYGTLEASNDFRFLPKKYGWFDRSLRFEANKSTASEFGRTLTSNTHMALYMINRSLAVCRQGTGRFVRSYYSYLGEKDGCRVFRIVFSQKNRSDYFYQILLFADRNTRYLQSVKVEAVSRQTGEVNNLYKFSTWFDCGLFTHKKPSLNTIYMPENVYYSYQPDDNFKFDIMLSDVRIRYKKF